METSPQFARRWDNRHDINDDDDDSDGQGSSLPMNLCDDDDPTEVISISSSVSGEGRKRKNLMAESCNAVSERLKRCRIAVSPGEIRLRKDLEDCCQQEDVSQVVRFVRTPDPLQIRVVFASVSGQPQPSHFCLKVPRFYPHSAPEVTAEESHYHGRYPFIRKDGRVYHPVLEHEWRGVYTLRTVIDTLQYVRSCPPDTLLPSPPPFLPSRPECTSFGSNGPCLPSSLSSSSSSPSSPMHT